MCGRLLHVHVSVHTRTCASVRIWWRIILSCWRGNSFSPVPANEIINLLRSRWTEWIQFSESGVGANSKSAICLICWASLTVWNISSTLKLPFVESSATVPHVGLMAMVVKSLKCLKHWVMTSRWTVWLNGVSCCLFDLIVCSCVNVLVVWIVQGV